MSDEDLYLKFDPRNSDVHLALNPSYPKISGLHPKTRTPPRYLSILQILKKRSIKAV
jgi:hypothetical protein